MINVLPVADLFYLLPELILSCGAMLLLVLEVTLKRATRGWLAWVGLAIIVASGASLVPLAGVNRTIANGLVAIDGFGLFFKMLVLLAAAITLLMSIRYTDIERMPAGEYYFLVLAATVGMMFMVSGIDLVTIFIGLETMAVSFYVLVGLLKPNRRSNEAAVKYFLLGAFSLGILLYGMSLMYGLSGTTNLRTIAISLSAAAGDPRLALAMILVVAGVGFKIAAVPFHMWAPDVYEGAPTPVTAFLSVGSKAASFAMLLRIFIEGLPFLRADWAVLFEWLAVVTMTVGNLAALTQSNVKRMLAYSSIAHAGYVLIGVVAATPRGITATMVYLFLYVFMQLGAFAVVVMLRRRDIIGDELKDLSGLGFRSPMAAVAMVLFMLSLGGIPPTAGFMGKLWLFGAAIDSGYVRLAVIGVLNSAISLYYYIRIVVFMWVREEALGSPVSAHPAVAVAITFAAVATLVLGIYPEPLFDFAQESARSLGTVAAAAAAAMQ